MSEKTGNTWPEQDVIDKWLKEMQIDVCHEDRMRLKRKVTDIRLGVQRKLRVVEGALKSLREARTTDAERLIILADRCSDLIFGGERGWEEVEFKDFVDHVAMRLRYTPDNDNPWRNVEDELPVIPKGRHGVSVIAAYLDPCNAQDVDDYCTGQMIYSSGNPEGFCSLAYGPKEAEWMPFSFEITHWKYTLKHPLDK